MLKLLYQLFNIKPQGTNPPTDQELYQFVNKIAGIKIRETEPNEKGKQYNWVSEVHPSAEFESKTGTGLSVIAQTKISSYSSNHNGSALNGQTSMFSVEDDVPF
jgi:hypothetical protein